MLILNLMLDLELNEILAVERKANPHHNVLSFTG